MSDRYFIDTNIFIYCFDTNAPDKLTIANDLVQNALSDGLGVTSYQVVQEFLNVALQKFEIPLTLEDTQVYIDSVFRPLCRLFPDISLYRDACDIKQRAGFSFYDCLIFSAASRLECSILYSEDFQHGFKLDDLTVANPFIAEVCR
jgi:predicted nucleic acid-binding protein